MLHAQRVRLRKNLLVYDPTEKFVLQEGQPFTIPPELPEEQEEVEEEAKEEVVPREEVQTSVANTPKNSLPKMTDSPKNLVESSLSSPPTPRYSYLHKIPNPMRSKAMSILSYLHFNVDPFLLKCLETGQVRAENTILPGADLSKILPSLLESSGVQAGEAYLLKFLRQDESMKRLLHPSKSGARSRQSFLEDTEYVDPPIERPSFRPMPSAPQPKQVTASYYDGLVSRPLSSNQMRSTSTVYVQPKVKVQGSKNVQKFVGSPRPRILKSRSKVGRSKPWYGLSNE